jgi:hypothetical protein
MPLSSDTLHNMLDSLLSGIHDEQRQLYQSAANDPLVEQAALAVRNHDLDGFFFSIPYTVEQLLGGILQAELPGANDAHFLLMRLHFVENHVKSIITCHEGSTSSTDKSRMVLSRLLKFLVTGERIVFDYACAKSYAMPTVVLCDHDQIVSLFNALKAMYYGAGEHFVQEMQSLSRKARLAQKALA